MSLVQLCVDDVREEAKATLAAFNVERHAQFNEWVEQSLRTWWRPFGAPNIKEAERRVLASRQWRLFIARTSTPVERVAAILEVCNMTPASVIHLSVTDWQLISEKA